jgi:uncharacterized membrane protein YcjF (UPF0283 family)
MNTPPKKRRLPWWKLALGLLLILAGIKNLDHRNIPQDLIPSNETQWLGFYLATILFLVAGLLLVFFAVMRIWRDRPQS